jgi:hypothetical protein
MPRDVEIGEGYEGDQMVTQVYPGQHRGHYHYKNGNSVLMRAGSRLNHIDQMSPFEPFPSGPISEESMSIPAKGRGGVYEGDYGRPTGGAEVVGQEEMPAMPIDPQRVLDGLGDPDDTLNYLANAANLAVKDTLAKIGKGLITSRKDAEKNIARAICLATQDFLKQFCKAVETTIQTAISKSSSAVKDALSHKGFSDVPPEVYEEIGGETEYAQRFAPHLVGKETEREVETGIGNDMSMEWKEADDKSVSGLDGFTIHGDWAFAGKKIYDDNADYIDGKLLSGMTPFEVFVASVRTRFSNLSSKEIATYLKAYYENYVVRQSVSQAASFGLRFPEDLRQDIAFSRLKVIPKSSQGEYEYPKGWTWSRPQIVKSLNVGSATDKAFLNMSRVFRTLQAFIPAFAISLVRRNMDPKGVYKMFKPPTAMPGLAKWVVEASTFSFERARRPEILKALLTDNELMQVMKGEELALEKLKKENAALKEAGVAIRMEISTLSSLKFIAEVISLPVRAIAHAVKEAAPWWLVPAGVLVAGAAAYGAVKGS